MPAAKTSPLERQLSPSQMALLWTVIIGILATSIYYLRSIMLPFAIAAFLAYALDPVVTWLSKHGLPRWGAALLLGVFVLSLFTLGLGLLIPLFIEQFSRLLQEIPNYIESLQLWLEPHLPVIQGAFQEKVLPQLEGFAREQASQIASYVGQFVQGLLQGGVATLAGISLLVMTPVLTFFFMRDWPHMLSIMAGLIPRYSYTTVTRLAREMDAAIAGFFRGQLSVCLILGLFYAIALTIAGLNYGFAIGMISGILTFIPYVGTIVGGVASIGVALFQFGLADWPMIAIIAGIYVGGQMVEGNILVPKLVGDQVGLHPLWVIFSLFAFGTLFGFLGVLLAIPLAAIVAVLLRYAVERYHASPLYGTKIS